MKLLMVSPELLGLAKTGGLADAVSGLTDGLIQLGHDVRVAIPYYSFLDKNIKQHAKPVGTIQTKSFGIWRIYRSRLRNITVYLFDVPGFRDRFGHVYADGDGIDWPDNGQRFGVFSHAVTAFVTGRFGASWKPDVVHVHDWTVGLVPFLLSMTANAPKTVLTIHNIAFQGNFPIDLSHKLRIPERHLSIKGIEFYGQLSMLKAGIIAADEVTTVSPTHSREMLTPEGGMGFDGILNARQKPLHGFLNGVDYHVWDPIADPYLAAGFDADNLSSRAVSKRALQRHVGLEEKSDAVVLVSTSRLVHQKLTDVLIDSIPSLLNRDTNRQIAIVGQGDRSYQNSLLELAERFPKRVGLRFDPSELSFHLAAAGGDIHIHGARFEPCGLSQQYALRYGCIPVASRVGGLIDTVIDEQDPLGREPNGFFFKSDQPDQFVDAIEIAIAARENSDTWQMMQRIAMRTPESWVRVAENYDGLYQSILRTQNVILFSSKMKSITPRDKESTTQVENVLSCKKKRG